MLMQTNWPFLPLAVWMPFYQGLCYITQALFYDFSLFCLSKLANRNNSPWRVDRAAYGQSS